MAFNELELKRIERALEDFLKVRRPPPEIRSQVDIGYKIDGQSVVIYEIRPQWDNPSNIIHSPSAKTTFVRSSNEWKIFWQRADLRWHRYEPCPSAKTIKEFLNVVDKDAYGCFWG